jgi:hypothetical protein
MIAPSWLLDRGISRPNQALVAGRRPKISIVRFRTKTAVAKPDRVRQAKAAPHPNFQPTFFISISTNSNNVPTLRHLHGWKRLFELYTLMLSSPILIWNSLCGDGLKFGRGDGRDFGTV